MKKSILISFVALMIVLGCSKPENVLNADLNENQLKSATPDKMVAHYFETKTTFNFPLVCDGTTIDILVGKVDVHCEMFGHYNPLFPGNKDKFISEFMIMNYTGTMTGSNTGEVFDIKRIVRMNIPLQTKSTIRFNVKGDKGTHVIYIETVNGDTGEKSIHINCAQIAGGE